MGTADGKWLEVMFGGMDERIAPSDHTAALVRNMVLDPDGAWRTAPGLVPVGSFSGSEPILAVRWFQPAPNQRWLVFERMIAGGEQSEIGYVALQAGTPTQITTRRRVTSATSTPTQFVDVGRWLYILSPFDGPIRWNGWKIRAVGFSTPPPAPRVIGSDQGFTAVDYSRGGTTPKHETQQRGVGEYPASADAPWRYGYGLTVINDLQQESPLSPLTFVSGTNGTTEGRQLVKVLIPQPPPDTRAFRLWRTTNVLDVQGPGDGLPVFLHSEWPVSHECELYDHKPDSELLIQFDPDRVGLVPQGPRAAGLWQNCLWLGGMPDDPSRLRYSEPGLIEQFPELNYIPIGTSRTGAIIAMYPVPRGLVVFKEGGIYIVKGNAVTVFAAEVISEHDGCAAPLAIEYVPDRGLYFVDRVGPKLLTGTVSDDEPTRVVPLVGTIRKVWRQAGPFLDRAVSVYDPDRREIWWQVPNSGNVFATFGVSLHLDVHQFSTREGYAVTSMTRYRNKTWLGSTPGIWLLSDAGLAYNQIDRIESTYITNYIVADERWQSRRLEVQMMAVGELGVELDTKTDRALDHTTQGDHERLLKQQLHDRELWEIGLWGAEYRWTDYDPTWIAFDLVDFAGHELLFRLRGEDVVMARGRLLRQPAPVAARLPGER